MIRSIPSLLVWVGFCLGFLPAMAHGQTFSEGLQHFNNHNLTAAYASFEREAQGNGTLEDREKAELWLALLDWRYHLRENQARERLQRWLADNPERHAAWLALSRLELAHGHFEAAETAAAQSLLFAREAAEMKRSQFAFARVAIQRAKPAFLAKGKLEPALSKQVGESVTVLHGLLTNDPDYLEAAKHLLHGALMTGSGEQAFDAWLIYYEGWRGSSSFESIMQLRSLLASHLKTWRGDWASTEVRDSVTDALVQSRLFGAAALVAKSDDAAASSSKTMHKALAYGAFVAKVAKDTDVYYQKLSIGDDTYDAWQASLIRDLGQLWDTLAWGDPWPDFETVDDAAYQDIVRNFLPKAIALVQKEFGGIVNIGTTAGYRDLHFGHIVVESTQAIEQYNQRGEITYQLLDHMASNGFQSWAWDFRSQHGGWATRDTIIQIRGLSSEGMTRRWGLVHNPAKASDHRKKIQGKLENDLQTARAQEVAYLPGVKEKMELAGLEVLYQKTKIEGDPTAHQAAFKKAYFDTFLGAAIFAHEGRHVIDKRLGIQGSPELEYRAKLSEVAFSAHPKISVATNIFVSSISGKTPHGLANKRFMAGVARWIKENHSQIAGYDPSLPALFQVDLLTDEQWRAAARSLDPLAKKS